MGLCLRGQCHRVTAKVSCWLGRAEVLFARSFQGYRKMALRAVGVALLVSTLPVAGCGTVVNLSKSHPEAGAKIPFGGVRQDVRCMEKAQNGGVGCKTCTKSELEPIRQTVFLLGCAA